MVKPLLSSRACKGRCRLSRASFIRDNEFCRVYYSTSDDALLLQRRNLLVAIPQLAQDLDRMLPQHGRRARELRASHPLHQLTSPREGRRETHFHPFAVVLHRRRNQLDPPRPRVLDLPHQIPLPRLRMLKSPLDIVHRRKGESLALEELEPVRGWVGREGGFD